MSKIVYTGIGSRRTPQDVLAKMRAFGTAFARQDFTLRSGGAPGADTAFEDGCDKGHGPKEIYLPWKGFQNRVSEWHTVTEEALDMAADFYGSGWQFLKRPTRLLMARNIYQVLGYELDDPSDFVVCWTPDGSITRAERTKETGGTGQAIACASFHNIPIFNLAREGSEDELIEMLGGAE